MDDAVYASRALAGKHAGTATTQIIQSIGVWNSITVNGNGNRISANQRGSNSGNQRTYGSFNY
ncbi:hypothetical protein CSC94_23050 [Zhengella mangrovi]|uniref:Uncharacterized protein n=1 Tax=Zhengella mangrovi TaxID=1982044 RepID=A0A2G1QHL6_9HYPH|nr:hypothetical protein CSC94_23050 [Zhengella mangrovi]